MERQANYILVAAFMLVCIALCFVFVLWMGGRQEGKQKHYIVYFDGGVNGIGEGTNVRYLGVNVGRVNDLRLDPEHPDRVTVIIQIDATTPVRSNTTATIRMQGVTGLGYIELKGTTLNAPKLAKVEGLKYRVIPTAPSEIDRLINGAPEIMEQMLRITNKIDTLLNEKNLKSIGHTIENIDAITSTMADNRQVVQDTLSSLHDISQTLADTSSRASGDIEQSLKLLRRTSEALANTTERLDALFLRREGDIDHFAGQGLPELTKLSRESRATASALHDLLENLDDNPSQLIYPPTEQGVVIPR